MSPEERARELMLSKVTPCGHLIRAGRALEGPYRDSECEECVAGHITTAIDEALGELREWVLGFPPPNEPEEYTAHCERGRVAREIDRRRKALRGEQ